jgi:glutamate dehydrogenase (NADP+)
VTVSYFEWVQNRAGFYWTEQVVHERLYEIMNREYQVIHERMTGHDTDMRTAAYGVALDRIGEAIAATGTQSYFNEDES